MTAPDLATFTTVDDFARAAEAALPRMAWDYYRSGADTERTLSANRDAFARWTIWYRVLRDVAERELATTVMGTPVSMPILIAPTAYHKLAHPDGEVASARAAAAAGTVFVLSTLATTSIEDVARGAAGPQWFQLYVHRDRGLTRSLVERAEAAGHRALVLTVDTPMLGRRILDEKNGFCLPDGMVMANLVGAPGVPSEGGSALAKYIASRHDPALGFRDVAWLKSITKLPLLLKGIVRGDDARAAVDSGADGIIVSNHGGRQLDCAPGTLEALPEVVEAVAGRAEVLLDGGIRWGTDIIKALALGARAVLVGRPILWGLATAGEPGVARVLELLREDLSRSMALAGCRSLSDLTADLVRPTRR